MSQPPKSPLDIRRWIALGVSIALFVVATLVWAFAGGDSGSDFLIAACVRIGLLMGALWLAWPSLKKPAQWLPAGAPVIGVIALVAIAAQPRLALPAIPIVAALVSFSAIVRAFRGRK